MCTLPFEMNELRNPSTSNRLNNDYCPPTTMGSALNNP